RTTAFTLGVTLAFTAATPTSSGTGNTYYVAKTGSDSNSCSEAQNQSTPKLTINAGIQCLSSGDTLNIRAGTYTDDKMNLSPSQSGTSYNNPTTIQAYSTEVVTIVGYCFGLSSPSAGQAYRYFIFKNLICDGSTIARDSSNGFGIVFGGGA